MLVAARTLDYVESVKEELRREFDTKDLGEARRILGMDIRRDRKKGELHLTQADYLSKVISRFQMESFKEVSVPLALHFKLSSQQAPANDEESAEMQKIPYANMIGSGMYLMICTRPDLSHGISVTSRYMKDHGKEHWAALKWIMRYLKGNKSTGIVFKRQKGWKEEPLIG